MGLQIIQDGHGKPTGVFIPIEQWQSLKDKYSGLQDEELQITSIPDWHKTILDERLEDYRINPNNNIDFDTMIKNIKLKYSL